jgi:hypothetical protein
VRRAIIASLVVAILAGFASADAPPAESKIALVFDPPKRVFVGQTIHFGVDVHYDLEWAAEHLVSVFRQPMDVALHVEIPWLREFREAEITPVLSHGEFPTLAVNDAVRGTIAVDPKNEEPDGHLTLFHTFRCDRPGPLRLAGPQLRFTWAPRFDEDVVIGRVPVEPREVVVRAPDVVIDVEPVPMEGRPAEWQGAIGRFSVRMRKPDTGPIEVGKPFAIELAIGGLYAEYVPTPTLDVPGFHELGSIAREALAEKTITYSIAAIDATTRAVPGVSFAYFDPKTRRYEIARTEPISLEVRAPTEPPEPPLPPRPPPSTKPARPEIPEPPAWRWGVMAVVTILFAVLLPPLVRRSLRRRGARAHDPGRARLDAALATLRATSPSDPGAFADALADVLAAHLNAPRSAAISPDLVPRLVHAGLDPSLASRAAAALDSLVSSRYGGPAPDPALLERLSRDLAT